MLRLCYALKSLTTRYRDLSVLRSLKMLRAGCCRSSNVQDVQAVQVVKRMLSDRKSLTSSNPAGFPTVREPHRPEGNRGIEAFGNDRLL